MSRAAALTGIVVISFSAIWVRLAEVAPAASAFYRTLYALPILWIADRLAGTAGRPRRVRWMAAAAGALLAVDLNLWHRSIEWIGAGLATVLANLQVVFVGLVAWILYRERPTRTTAFTVPVVLVGVALISGLGREDAFGTNPIAGALAGVGAAITYAGFLLVFRHAMRGRSERSVGPLLDATAGAAVANLILLLAAGEAGSLIPSWPAHGWLVVLALGSQVFGWLLIAHALPRLAGLETAVLLLVQPGLTVLWAQLLFDEPLAAAQWAGVAIVLGGILLVAIRGTVEPSPRHEP